MVEEEEKEDPKEDLKKDLKEDRRDPTKKMEEDPKEDSKHGPSVHDPRDGGMMHIENKPIPIAEVAYSEYDSIGFYEREDSIQWEWQIDKSPEYHSGPYYDLEDDNDDYPTCPKIVSFFFILFHSSSKCCVAYHSCMPCGHPCTSISYASNRLPHCNS
uniref:Uncharacterized protein n=1 Tax=Solanum tuberosum TaxID=4113 RepID=M1DGI2_SOLTU